MSEIKETWEKVKDEIKNYKRYYMVKLHKSELSNFNRWDMYKFFIINPNMNGSVTEICCADGLCPFIHLVYEVDIDIENSKFKYTRVFGRVLKFEIDCNIYRLNTLETFRTHIKNYLLYTNIKENASNICDYFENIDNYKEEINGEWGDDGYCSPDCESCHYEEFESFEMNSDNIDYLSGKTTRKEYDNLLKKR